MAYQYGTSPRKLEPEYEIPKKTVPKKKKVKVAVKKRKLKPNAKAVLYVLVGFVILFTISYRNSLINVTFNKKEELKKSLSVLEKENEQLKVGIEQSLNLNNVEKVAKESLGMQKLDNLQKKYISVEKKDYIEPAAEEVKMEEEGNWFSQLWNKIFGK